MSVCSLCGSQADFFYEDKKRSYFHCGECSLIFVPKQFHLSSSQEKREYDYHENDPSDQRYRQFLSKIVTPLEKYIQLGMQGLDFGSGPGPTLHLMLQEKGFPMKIYDPFYANDPLLVQEKYDFVTCTEVVEHFNDPKSSWGLLSQIVKKNGYLAIMTLFWNSSIKESFSTWWYKNNDTHVTFYSHQTLQWLEHQFALNLLYADERAAVFKKL